MHHLLSNKYLDVTAWGKLYRTTLFKDIRFPIGKYHEDIYTTYKLVEKCDKIVSLLSAKIEMGALLMYA